MKEEQEKILQAVKNNEITIEEALEQLEKLEQQQNTFHDYTENDFDSFKKSAHDDEQTHYNYETKSAADKILEFVDSTFKRVKDFDFNFTKFETVNHIFQQTDAELDEINFDIANGSIEIMPWDQPDIRIECEAKVHRANNLEDAREQFLEQVTFSTSNKKLVFITQQKMLKVTVICYVPKFNYEEIKLRLFNGPITAKRLITNELELKTANGTLVVDGVTSEDTSLETANGNITVDNSFIDNIGAETLNGKVNLNGDFYKVSTKTFNGNIETILKGERCKFVEQKALTGSIETVIDSLLIDKSLYGHLKTYLGNFKVNLGEIEIIEEKKDITNKELRFRSTVESADKQLHLFADTKTGLISLKKMGTF